VSRAIFLSSSFANGLFLIGDEDSSFHKPVRFSLEQQAKAASVQ
jgi:hypothetical protein